MGSQHWGHQGGCPSIGQCQCFQGHEQAGQFHCVCSQNPFYSDSCQNTPTLPESSPWRPPTPQNTHSTSDERTTARSNRKGVIIHGKHSSNGLIGRRLTHPPPTPPPPPDCPVFRGRPPPPLRGLYERLRPHWRPWTVVPDPLGYQAALQHHRWVVGAVVSVGGMACGGCCCGWGGGGWLRVGGGAWPAWGEVGMVASECKDLGWAPPGGLVSILGGLGLLATVVANTPF